MIEELNKEDAIIEAEIEINAHRLGEFMRDKRNREAIQARKNGLLDIAVEQKLVNFDILTQAALARLWHNIMKEEIKIFDLQLMLFVGYVLGKEYSD